MKSKDRLLLLWKAAAAAFFLSLQETQHWSETTQVTNYFPHRNCLYPHCPFVFWLFLFVLFWFF